MIEKVITLLNKGMKRDLSVSKADESSAYENHNVRLLARDNDTLLSVTNERGNKVVDGVEIKGTVIGWNILNRTIVVFSHDYSSVDRIYKIVYDGDSFASTLLFTGNLNMDADHPIESIVYYESDNIQKIYWIDGKNVLRFMNFAAEVDGDGHYPWQNEYGEYDTTYFDSNRRASHNVSVSIEKDNTGNSRPNGVVQYILTYFNKHGQESGAVWFSDVVYLSPFGVGGSADGSNNNRVLLRFSNLDTSFTNFRVYSVFRSTNNGTTSAYLISEQKTSSDSVLVSDDFTHSDSVDPSSLIYLGSRKVIAGTLTAKDETLFLGDLKSIGKNQYSDIEDAIRTSMFGKYINNVFTQVPFEENVTWEAFNVSFVYTNDAASGTVFTPEAQDIPYVTDDGNYPYNNQLEKTSSGILTFKGGEKYRFALKFKMRDGSETDAFWIGDKENTLYPVIDETNLSIKRVVAKCTIPQSIMQIVAASGEYAAVQLMIAYATDADRSVKAQGIVNPTMFNVWERYNDRLYSMPSWISRLRGSGFPSRHFDCVRNASTSQGEIQCNYWKGSEDKKPYFQYDYSDVPKPVEEFEGIMTFETMIVVYRIMYVPLYTYNCLFYIIQASNLRSDISGAKDKLDHYEFSYEDFQTWSSYESSAGGEKDGWKYKDVKDTVDGEEVTIFRLEVYMGVTVGEAFFNHGLARRNTYESLRSRFNGIGLGDYIVGENTFLEWCESAFRHNSTYELSFNPMCYGTQHFQSTDGYETIIDALNARDDDSSSTDPPSEYRWGDSNDYGQAVSPESAPAYYKKHLMFVDENIITLDSPEIAYGKSSFDNAEYKFRIVGVAKMSSVISDYLVSASNPYMPGNSLDILNFSGRKGTKKPTIDGILSWPLWKEFGLDLTDEASHEVKKPEERVPSDYNIGKRTVAYWLYMWHKVGAISGYSDEDNKTYSSLESKTFANLRFSYSTIYLNGAGSHSDFAYEPDFVRVTSDINDTYKTLKIGRSEQKYYDGRPELSLGMPGILKYPLPYSDAGSDDTGKLIAPDDAYLYSSTPVILRYSSQSHAIIGLHTEQSDGDYYTQTVLPKFFESESLGYLGQLKDDDNSITGPLIPWANVNTDNLGYPYRDYRVIQRNHLFASNDYRTGGLQEGDNYLLIGEIYRDYSAGQQSADTRYGGISLSDVRGNMFITAGPQYVISEDNASSDMIIIGNQGDTYFQRWDALRITPYSNDSENNVIDITSAMLETHINLDGRTDRQRGISEIASINTTSFGNINDVYSQVNSFSVRRDLDEDFNTDSYRSSITWTLPKTSMSEVDEWSHITLASSLALDGDKGPCNALRRFANSIVAFQDRAISEIMFNSRTTIAANNGVPIELANSGKVDGKRYISNKFGCTNKWSIVEGKYALYFVDSINKAFCSFRESVSNISSSLGFGAWFRNNNLIEPWKPSEFNNIVSYYDRIHSDVYLVKKDDTEQSCLVYNETIEGFTSFFDYGSMDTLVNVDDRLVSIKNGRLWLQNEGLFCNFFGKQYPFWMHYRVTPDLFTDKIWTNLEYRADFYRILNPDGTSILTGYEDISDLDEMDYREDETFDSINVWNEYQSTGEFHDMPEKKFRTWRYQIPRAASNDDNIYSMDRIRNPWINLKLSKESFRDENMDLMQLHNITVKYFE